MTLEGSSGPDHLRQVEASRHLSLLWNAVSWGCFRIGAQGVSGLWPGERTFLIPEGLSHGPGRKGSRERRLPLGLFSII